MEKRWIVYYGILQASSFLTIEVIYPISLNCDIVVDTQATMCKVCSWIIVTLLQALSVSLKIWLHTHKYL